MSRYSGSQGRHMQTWLSTWARAADSSPVASAGSARDGVTNP